MNAIKWLGWGVVVLGLVSCSGGKYADTKSAMKEQTSAMEDFAARVDKAGSAKEVATALDRYADQMAKMMEQGKKLKEKYSGVDLGDAPELKAESEQVKQAAMKFTQAFMKISMQYGNDPEVQAALKKWQANMSQAARP
ncbi:MAG: hypothetical protein KJ726_00495 [Verrucomicrobia bacterium]|nr:hypothetical protein [Verrucomicrobiota bacterium]MBU1908508.1 hypothetical protein [Verrucomicrobiota bacterium]